MMTKEELEKRSTIEISLSYVMLATAERFSEEFLHTCRAIYGMAAMEKKKIFGTEMKLADNLLKNLRTTYDEALSVTDDFAASDQRLVDDSWYLVRLVNLWAGMDTYERMSLLRHAEEIGHPVLDDKVLERMRPKTMQDI